MPPRSAVLIVAAVLSAPSFAQSTLTPDQIADAIRLGQQGKHCIASLGNTLTDDYTVTLAGPQGRVAHAAAEAKASLQLFGPADVTDAHIAPVLDVRITPHRPQLVAGRWRIVAPVTHVVLAPKGAKQPDAAVQPDAFEQIPAAWTNALGAHFESQGGRAQFPLDALPPGEVVVIVVAGTRQHTFTLKQKHRDALFCK